jgi:hypothetical protein
VHRTELPAGGPPKLYLPSHFATAVAASPAGNSYRPDIFFLVAIGRLRARTSLAQLNAELAAANPSFLARIRLARDTGRTCASERHFGGPTDGPRYLLLY